MNTGSNPEFLRRDERFSLILKEYDILQATFDKYDDLISRQRNFFITTWSAISVAALTFNNSSLYILLLITSVGFFLLEGLFRHQYWWKYVQRYRTIRDHLHEEKPISEISLFDTTNRYMPEHESKGQRIKKCFFKLDAVLIYGLFCTAALLLWHFAGFTPDAGTPG